MENEGFREQSINNINSDYKNIGKNGRPRRGRVGGSGLVNSINYFDNLNKIMYGMSGIIPA